MNKIFTDIRTFASTLTDSEFAFVAEYLENTVSDYVDYNDRQHCAVYCYRSAASGAAAKLNITDQSKLDDIEFVAFEFHESL